MRSSLALDIGGTKLAAGLVDSSGRLHDSRSVPTSAKGGAEGLFANVVALARETLEGVAGGVGACGVGCGGPMTPGGAAVSPLNIPAWTDFPLRRRLEEELGLPVFVDNDAKALALAEGWLGAAVGRSSYMAMVVSTGVGGGIVLDGRLLQGDGGNAGHVGHVIVVPGGRRCACGAQGCLEAEASGSAISAMTGAAPRDADPEIVRRSGRLVGRAVANVGNLLDLGLAVVAGSVALGYGAPFFTAAQGEVDRRARISFSRGTRVVPAGLGRDGPLIGAGAVAWRGLGGR